MASDENNQDITRIIKSDTLSKKIDSAKVSLATLRQMNGTLIGRKYPVNEGKTIIGRDPELQIVISDESISRKHAELNFDGTVLEIADLKSTNGTYINKIKIEKKIIKKGDLIRLGSIILKYIPPGDIEGVFHDDLHNLAYKDGLTGAYNRKYLQDYLKSEINRTRQLDLPLSLIMFDLDHFKKINDTYGHQTGDYVLIEISSLINTKLLRGSDVLCRYGGEEFCITLSETACEKAANIAERVRSAVYSHKFVYNNKKIKVTISAGVAEISDKILTQDDLISAADKLLYSSKEGGRNRVSS